MRNLTVAVVAVVASSTYARAVILPAMAAPVASVNAAITNTIQGASSGTIAAPKPLAPTPRLRIRGQKWVAPQLQRSEAGISWSVSPKVTLELNYERSAMAPTMPHDHDDGFLTRLKLSF